MSVGQFPKRLPSLLPPVTVSGVPRPPALLAKRTHLGVPVTLSGLSVGWDSSWNPGKHRAAISVLSLRLPVRQPRERLFTRGLGGMYHLPVCSPCRSSPQGWCSKSLLGAPYTGARLTDSFALGLNSNLASLWSLEVGLAQRPSLPSRGGSSGLRGANPILISINQV